VLGVKCGSARKNEAKREGRKKGKKERKGKLLQTKGTET
jgi:hypothetical protein